MSRGKTKLVLSLVLTTAVVVGCNDQNPTDLPADATDAVAQAAKGGGGKPNPELAGNNLSFPVIWAEGVTKVLPGTYGMAPLTSGAWWYQWGTNGIDPDVTPASCAPDPDEGNLDLNPDGLPLCDDGVVGTVNLGLVAGYPPASDPLPLAKAYLQKDPLNQWQAVSYPAPGGGTPQQPINVDLIDWGDNLESVDWYTKSQVRTEVVLFEDVLLGDAEEHGWPLLPDYGMRHVSGWGINEVHGLAATLASEPILGQGTMATVYSHCARLTIQKLLLERDEGALTDLVWVPGEGWAEPEGYGDDLINPAIFNMAVYEGGDGPGYYSAEINVKGRIIFGYTWNVRKLNDGGAGDYRITFSFDEVCGGAELNTYFAEGITAIKVPEEEPEEPAPLLAEDDGGESPGGGAVGVLRTDLNLTYIDVRILERGGGGGGGGKGGGGGGSGGGGGGGGGPGGGGHGQ